MFDYKKIVSELHQPLVDLTCTVASIPSPSHDEWRKADFIVNYFKDLYPNIYKDEVGNVIIKLENPGKEKIIFAAHIDTVFPIDTVLNPVIKDGRIHCPSCGDDTANVCALMLIAKYVKEHNVKFNNYEVWFVFTVGEEGLGNLYGAKHLMKDVTNVKNFICLDMSYMGLATEAVGSKRYEISITTKGGHSFNKFGNTSAIHMACKLINQLINIDLPSFGGAKSTYNVGTIEGGTSVNSIAGYCKFLYEYRTCNNECMDYLDKQFNDIMNNFDKLDANIDVKIVGERKSAGYIDPVEKEELIKKASDIITLVTGYEPVGTPHSMDYNVAMSMGIPSIGIGVYDKGTAHSLQENISIESMKAGIEILFRLVETYID